MTTISALRPVDVAIPINGATPDGPPTPKPAEYSSIKDLALTFFKEKAKDIAKTGSYLAFWATKAIPDLPQGVTKFNYMLRDFKNFMSATELPQKFHELGQALSGFVKTLAGRATDGTWDEVGKKAREVFKKTTSLINASGDSLEFTNIFVPLGKEVMRWVSGINFAATIGFAGNATVEQIESLSKENIGDKKTTFYLINLARDVSYLVLGIIGFTFVVTATPFVPWVIVACLTSGLAFSIGSYFYERIVDPENKGKNLKPETVVENYVNQRNYEQRTAQTV
jgi:hypothetical protein